MFRRICYGTYPRADRKEGGEGVRYLWVVDDQSTVAEAAGITPNTSMHDATTAGVSRG